MTYTLHTGDDHLQISWLFISISTVLAFILLLVLVRWIGATQLTQLTFFNWVAGASMGNIAANMIAAGNAHDLISSAYELTLFSAATIVAAFVALKSRGFRRISNGEPIVLIHRGTILRHNLSKTKLNVDVLMMLLREKGYFAYEDIEFAVLEPTGNLSILPTQASQSATKEDLAYGPDLSPEGQGPYVEIIVDGEVDEDKLKETGHDRAWLDEEVHKQGADSLADVMYLGVNKEGEVMADLHRKETSGDMQDPVV